MWRQFSSPQNQVCELVCSVRQQKRCNERELFLTVQIVFQQSALPACLVHSSDLVYHIAKSLFSS